MKYKGKLVSFSVKSRKAKLTGVVLDYNSNWTLIKRSCDYTLDGFTIFRNLNVEHYYGEFEIRANKILKLKGYDYKTEPKIPIDSLEEIINYINIHHQLIQVDTKDGYAFDVVKLKKYTGKRYLLDELMPNGKWRDEMDFAENIFRVISFDNDYLNSIKLITKFKKQQ